VTVTPNVHEACWVPASAALQMTGVTPAANVVPETGEQVAWMGAVPPDVVGAGHDIATGWFWSDNPD
jgi:hypothetical protein